MRKRFIGCLLCILVISGLLFPLSVQAEKARQNQYPIILVYGLAGWGRDELLGVKYWGGVHDIQENLKKEGYSVYTSAVGPVSSSWDRACELYAQIYGGTVDYGAAHAAKHGHARYGRTYTGFLKNWNDTNKVHLLGHSMGGQTIRMLVQLLKEGSDEEKKYAQQHAGTELSPLFEGGKSYVHSVTTLGSPHNGTTLADGSLLLSCIKQWIVTMAAVGESSSLSVYDFKLDQWGIKKKSGESFAPYLDRILGSSIWGNTKDTSQWDISTLGASEINQWVKAQPDVYYFSYSAHATFPGLLTGFHYPHITMNKLLLPSAMFLGSFARYDKNHPIIDSSWWQNDGVVNTKSMMGPSTDKISSYRGKPQKGIWNHVETKHNWDHFDLIGWSISDALGLSNITAFYRSIAERLAQLPQ